MIQMTEQEFQKLEDNIDMMIYKPGDNFDYWYPDIATIKERMKNPTRTDIMFLLWLTKPGMKLNEDQKKVKKEIHKMLYNPEILRLISELTLEGGQ